MAPKWIFNVFNLIGNTSKYSFQLESSSVALHTNADWRLLHHCLFFVCSFLMSCTENSMTHNICKHSYYSIVFILDFSKIFIKITKWYKITAHWLCGYTVILAQSGNNLFLSSSVMTKRLTEKKERGGEGHQWQPVQQNNQCHSMIFHQERRRLPEMSGHALAIRPNHFWHLLRLHSLSVGHTSARVAGVTAEWSM